MFRMRLFDPVEPLASAVILCAVYDIETIRVVVVHEAFVMRPEV